MSCKRVNVASQIVLLILSLFASSCARKPEVKPTTTVPAVGAATVVDANEARILGTVPDFRLTDQAGAEFGLADLTGKVWIANFAFTRCAATCPIQSSTLSQLQATLRTHASWANIRLVTITVDPAFDTPEILANYAQQYDADPERWHFLTGDREAIWSLSKDGFKLPVGEAPETTEMPIFHSPQFILVDDQGRIRGYFDSGKPTEVQRLEESAKSLVSATVTHQQAAVEL